METNEIMYQKSYQEYKAELDGELQKTAEGFVRIGYLLKVARDTNILAESGYKSVAEFAEAEYNLNKTQVSRFISINDKFSEGGYSDHLIPEYRGFGYAKLTLMLQLPDAVNEGLTPGYSKSEIQAIKDEVEEENKVSDIERMLEPVKEPINESLEKSLLGKTIVQLGEEEPELFARIAKVLSNQNMDELKAELAPQGEKTYSVRIPGNGRVMLMLAEQECRLVHIRSGEKENIIWHDIRKAWAQLIGTGEDPKETWSKLYCKPYPGKEEIAPVQQNAENKPKKESKVTKAKEPPKEPNEKEEAPKHSVDVNNVVPEDHSFQMEKMEDTIATGYNLLPVDHPAETTEMVPEKHHPEAGKTTEEPKAENPNMAAAPVKLTEEETEVIPPPRRATEWRSQVNRCLSNLQIEIKSDSWEAAKTTLRKMEHYIDLVVRTEL